MKEFFTNKKLRAGFAIAGALVGLLIANGLRRDDEEEMTDSFEETLDGEVIDVEFSQED